MAPHVAVDVPYSNPAVITRSLQLYMLLVALLQNSVRATCPTAIPISNDTINSPSLNTPVEPPTAANITAHYLVIAM